MMVSRMREAGELIVRVCSAWVSQLMKSCSELWKSVAIAKASSSFTYDQLNTSYHLRFMYRDKCESLVG